VFSYSAPDCSHTIGIVFLAQVRGNQPVVPTDADDNEWVGWLSLDEAKGVLEIFGDHNFDALVRGAERLRCGCALPKGSGRGADLACERPRQPARSRKNRR
jgi:hypothetical protein